MNRSSLDFDRELDRILASAPDPVVPDNLARRVTARTVHLPQFQPDDHAPLQTDLTAPQGLWSPMSRRINYWMVGSMAASLLVILVAFQVLQQTDTVAPASGDDAPILIAQSKPASLPAPPKLENDTGTSEPKIASVSGYTPPSVKPVTEPVAPAQSDAAEISASEALTLVAEDNAPGLIESPADTDAAPVVPPTDGQEVRFGQVDPDKTEVYGPVLLDAEGNVISSSALANEAVGFGIAEGSQPRGRTTSGGGRSPRR